MKEWILYCLLCSLIYAMSVQAKALPQQPLTAFLIFSDKSPRPVVDCAVFIPNFDEAFGEGSTEEIEATLRKKKFIPTQLPFLQILESSQANSAGQVVTMYETNIDYKKLNRYGRNTIYLSMTGLVSTIQKHHKFTIRMHSIGSSIEIDKTVTKGTLGQAKYTISSLPNCVVRDNY